MSMSSHNPKDPSADPYIQGNAPDGGGEDLALFCEKNPDHPICHMSPKEYADYQQQARVDAEKG